MYRHLTATAVGIGLLLSGPAAFAGSPLGLPGGDAVSIGIYIAPVANPDCPIVSHDSDRLMTPASTLKTLTAASALLTLGPDFQWSTRAMAVGEVTDGGLHGDIVIRGSADPTLGSRFLTDPTTDVGFAETIVGALTDRGISRISGTVIIDHSQLPDSGINAVWQVEDIGWDYGTGLYAFNYRDNAFALDLPSGRTFPTIPGLKIISSVTAAGTTDRKPLTVTRGVGSHTVKITGNISRNKSATLWCSTPDPSAVFIHELDSLCLAEGIRIGDKPARHSLTDTVEIANHRSLPLKSVLRSLMVRSDNLMAEGTYRALAPQADRRAAAKRTREIWKNRGIDLDNTYLLDGSGLARGNAVSPRQLGQVLAWMARSESAADYVDLFPRAGLDGTLRSFLSRNKRNREFVLKTGSMSGVHCYAGYRLNPHTGKPTHIIVIMVNNFFGPRANIRKATEKLLLNTHY